MKLSSKIPVGVLIRTRDLVLAGHCVKGQRDWFAVHGLDFDSFRMRGIDAGEMIDKGDGVGHRAVVRVFARHLREVRRVAVR